MIKEEKQEEEKNEAIFHTSREMRVKIYNNYKREINTIKGNHFKKKLYEL